MVTYEQLDLFGRDDEPYAGRPVPTDPDQDQPETDEPDEPDDGGAEKV